VTILMQPFFISAHFRADHYGANLLCDLLVYISDFFQVMIYKCNQSVIVYLHTGQNCRSIDKISAYGVGVMRFKS